MKEEMSEIMLRYLNNISFLAVAITVPQKCSKCQHHFSFGERVYRDVMTGKIAHITCRQKKTHREQESEDAA